MSFRRLMTVGVLAVSAVVLPALPGSAAPSTGPGCTYPTNSPRLTITASPSTITAGNFSTVFGKFTVNGCAIKNAVIRIQRRVVVNGRATGHWANVKSSTTSSKGIYAAAYFATRNVRVRAHFSGTNGFPTTNTFSVPLNVHTAITESITKRSGCRLTIAGHVNPVKVNRVVRIQKRGPRGSFHGWTTVAKATTNRHGHYSVTKTFVCGRGYNLSAYIAKDSINLSGRSATLFGVKPRH